jgi:hypothetical protein
MPKYMEQPHAAYEIVVDAINDDITRNKKSGNKKLILGKVDEFINVAEDTMRNVRDNWRSSAIERVGQLGLQVTTEIDTANGANLIVPPLTEGDMTVLAMQRAMFAGLVELANPRESNGPTPTQPIATDTPKA